MRKMRKNHFVWHRQVLTVNIPAVLTILVVMIISMISSCSDSAASYSAKNISLTDEAARKIVMEFMPVADKFYAIYNRCSLMADSSVSVKDANGFMYSPVISVYVSLASLKEDTERYFTKEFAESSFYIHLDAQYAFYKDIDGQLYKNTDAMSEGKSNWRPEQCMVSELSNTGFTATVPYSDAYEVRRVAKIDFLFCDGDYKINGWEMNLEDMR